MKQRIEFKSDTSVQEIRDRLSSLYKHEHWWSLPKGIVGDINAGRVRIGIENGVVFWPGRGKFEGLLKEVGPGSTLVGQLNSPWFATLFPLIFVLPIAILMPQELPKLLLLGAVFCGFGYFVVRSDHTQLMEVLRDATKRNG
jgi:hypothetical protein